MATEELRTKDEHRALQKWQGVVLAMYAQDQCRLKNNGKQLQEGFLAVEEGRHGFLQRHTTPLWVSSWTSKGVICRASEEDRDQVF